MNSVDELIKNKVRGGSVKYSYSTLPSSANKNY